MSKVYLSKIATHLPDDYKKTSDYYFNKVGIEKVPYTKENPYFLMHKAVEKLDIKDTNDIDYCIVCTENFETPIPPLSFKIHRDFNFKENCGCLDINHGCSGFLYSLEIGKSLIQANKDIHNILIVCGDAYSKISRDEATSNIFGDGASAILITDNEEKGIAEILEFSKISVYSDAIKQDKYKPLKMNGHEVIDLAMLYVPRNFSECLSKNKMSSFDINLVIPHQSNPCIIKALEKVCMGKSIQDCFFISDMKDTGNLVQTSIPYVLEKYIDIMNKNVKVMLIGYGVGFSVISTILKWR